MAKLERSMANLLLRYASPLTGLRGVPLLGGLLSWTSRRLVPSDTLIWIQIKQGPAQGLWIRVNPRTGQSVQQGLGEPAVQQAMQQHRRSGMVFYDLGANIGFFSLIAAHLVGPSGQIFSFEADPGIAVRLRDNLACNSFTHATVVQKAVWSESGPVSFERVDIAKSPDRGLGRVSVDNSGATETILVEAVSLDQFTLSHPAPDFVKCDVEGSEVAVFEGAERLLREKRPILLVEMHGPENHSLLTQEFLEFGYNCVNLDDTHVLALPT